jgi:hypothetical protein
MLVIEGAVYRQCPSCRNWRPDEEVRWDDDLLAWVCISPDCIPSGESREATWLQHSGLWRFCQIRWTESFRNYQN